MSARSQDTRKRLAVLAVQGEAEAGRTGKTYVQTPNEQD
jgi:hypothetical protein